MYGIPILNLDSADPNGFKTNLTLTLDQSLQILATGSGIAQTKLDTVVALKVRDVLRFLSSETLIVCCSRWGGKFHLRGNKEDLFVVYTQDDNFEQLMKLSELQIKVLSKIIEVACAGIE